MKKIICSTGAFIGKSNQYNHSIIIEYASLIDCDGFELLMQPQWDDKLDSIRNDWLDNSIVFASMHTEKEIGTSISKSEPGMEHEVVKTFTMNCETACELGIPLLVLHLWGGRTSDRNLEINFSMYEKLAAIAKDYQLQLTVENVVCSYENPLKHMKTMIQRFPDVRFTVDTRFAAFHGQLDDLYNDNDVWNHIANIHISDYLGEVLEWERMRFPLHPRDGSIDFSILFRVLKEKSYTGNLVLESSSSSAENGIDLQSMNRSLQYLRDNFS